MWHAKLIGGYNINSDEARENALEFYNITSQYGWSLIATSACLGNMQHESGLNPWRWQSDLVSLTDPYKGYGLVQFTPAYGYIQGYGVGLQGFAPSTSTTEITGNVSDGIAQSICISQDVAQKYSIRTWTPLQYQLTWDEFKTSDNLLIATGAWLYNYESPQDPSSKLNERFLSAQSYYEYLSGHPLPTQSLPFWLLKKFYNGSRFIY